MEREKVKRGLLRNLCEFQTWVSSAQEKDGRHKTGSRRKGREEQIQVQVQSDQSQPQGRSVLVLTFIEGARKHLEASEVGAQEIHSLLSTWCKIQRVRLVELSLPPLLAKGYSACMWERLLCFLLIVPYPLTTHSTAIACLKHCSLSLSHSHSKTTGKRTLTPQKKWAACRSHSCRLGMKSTWRTCKILPRLSLQQDVDVNVASFSEQLLRVSICRRKNNHTPSNSNPTKKQALRDQQLPKISTQYSLKLHSSGFKGTWMQNTWAKETAHLWHVFIYLFTCFPILHLPILADL